MAKPATMDPSQPLSDEISQQLPPLFFAIEDSDCLARQCCHQYRGFTVCFPISRVAGRWNSAQRSLPLTPLLLQLCVHMFMQMHVLDGTNQPVLELYRPFTCTAKCTGVCMCPCPPNRLMVNLPSGQVLGEIIETNPLCNCDQ